MGAGWQRWWWAEDERMRYEVAASTPLPNEDPIVFRMRLSAASLDGGCLRCGAPAPVLMRGALWCFRHALLDALGERIWFYQAPGFNGRLWG